MKIEKRFSHSFLMEYLSSPKIDEDKLLMLYAIFNELNETDEVKENYMIVAMLVQIALDTHDEVTNSNQIKQSEFVKRQLTVLAGDYFSGLYYSILSEMKDIKMVRTLATAIKEINEHKIKVYENIEKNPTMLVESLLIVESALFQKISDYFNLDLWRKFCFNFLAFKRLTAEMDDHLFDHSLVHHFEYRRITHSYHISTSDLNTLINDYFDQSMTLLERISFRSTELKSMLKDRLQSIRFNEKMYANKTVEEGS